MIVAVGGLMFIKTKVAPPIKCINRCPAVMLAVSRTASAIGWMKRLMVSITINMGISEIGVPWGRKWAKEFFSLCRNPRITAPAHRGMAMLRFMDSWVVGVNVCGRRPRRFVEPMNMISETIIRVQVRPFGVWISIICLIISLISQCWNECSRLLIRRSDDGNRIDGNIIMVTTIGRPIIVGVMKEANRFSFILILKDFLLFLWL